MGQGETIGLIGFISGAVIGCFLTGFLEFLPRIKSKPLRLLCALCSPMYVLALWLLMSWLVSHRFSGTEELRRELAWSPMISFALVVILWLVSKQKAHKKRKWRSY
jgi:hypothetical protein